MDYELSFHETVRLFERQLIRDALNATKTEKGFSVTRAAADLGLTHQALGLMLNGRHRDLRDEMGVVRRTRHNSLIKKHRKGRRRLQPRPVIVDALTPCCRQCARDNHKRCTGAKYADCCCRPYEEAVAAAPWEL